MLGRTDAEYFPIGAGLRRTYLNATRGPGESELILRINDNRPGNGDGAFQVHIVVWRSHLSNGWHATNEKGKAVR